MSARANLFPSPLWGGAWGGARTGLRRRLLLRDPTPLPTLPHKGGGKVLRRRSFLALLGGAAAAWPLAARAQRAGKPSVIGFLTPDLKNPLLDSALPPFLAELKKLGFTEGDNLTLESRQIGDQTPESLAVVTELIRSNVDVLVAFGPEAALKAAAAATQTVPIVMVAVNYDPIAGGYVSNIARPSGNITGLVFRAPELAAKQLELLVEAFPNDKKIAVLWEPASAEQFDAAQRIAQTMRIELKSHKVEMPIDFDEAFGAIAHDGSGMLLVLSGPSFGAQRSHIADLAIKYRLPTMFTFKFYVEAGGLMSYGIDATPMMRRAASYVAKILRGAKPSDLPVEQPSNFEFALNLKTAKAAGFVIPTSILLRADEVIE
jgi:putative tryptophan/tyrosine transport system substrate-binding protein